MYSRRDFARLGLGGLTIAAAGGGLFTGAGAAAPGLESTINGVRVGLGASSLGPFPDAAAGADPIDAIVALCRQAGIANIELSNGLVEPALEGTGRGGRIPDPLTPAWNENRPKLRDWRVNAPLSRFQEIRRKFESNGMKVFSYVMTFTSDFTPAEIEAVFRQAEAIGAEVIITNQTQTFMARRLAPYQAKFRTPLSWHNHARTDDANEIASLESFDEVMAASPRYKLNLDIGHFTAGNQDSVAFLKKHHAKISHIHVKDRKRNNGPNVAWGQGDTPITEALRTIRDNKWPIVVVQEREYRGPDTGDALSEVRKNNDYIRRILTA